MTRHDWKKSFGTTQRELLFFSAFFAGLIVSLVVIVARNLGSANVSPYDNFLVAPVSQFGDFYGVHDEWNRIGWNGTGYGVSYFPSMYLFVEIMNFIEPKSQTLVILYLLAMVILSLILIFKLLRMRSFRIRIVFSCVFLLSYPLMLIYSTGNLEGLVMVFVFGWLYFTLSTNHTKAAVLLGLAVSVKLVPFVFILALVSIMKRNQFLKSVAITSFVAIGTNLLSLLILPTGIIDKSGPSLGEILRNIMDSQRMYADLMYYSEAGTHFGHSFLNGIHAFFGENILPTRDYSLPVILIFSFFMLLIVLISVTVKPKHQNFEKVLLSSAAFACLAVPTSTDYKLWYLFVPIVVALQNPKIKMNWLTVSACLTLFAKPYLYTGTQPWASATSYLTTLILALIFFGVLSGSILSLTKPRDKISQST